MVIDFLRIISLLFLIIITIIDIPMYKGLKDPQYQFIIAFIIIFILLVIDTGIGFILALAFLIIYFKIYNKYFISNIMNNNSENKNNDTNTLFTSNNNIVSKINYVSPEHLLSVQNNIVDINNYNTEVKGFKKGYNDENVYGAQGIDIDNDDYKGYENNKYQTF